MKTKILALLVVAVFLAGCNNGFLSQPGDDEAMEVTGQVNIEDQARQQDVTASITITEESEQDVTASLTILPEGEAGEAMDAMMEGGVMIDEPASEVDALEVEAMEPI